MIGATIESDRIVRQIGGGGMGAVWRASPIASTQTLGIALTRSLP